MIDSEHPDKLLGGFSNSDFFLYFFIIFIVPFYVYKEISLTVHSKK